MGLSDNGGLMAIYRGDGNLPSAAMQFAVNNSGRVAVFRGGTAISYLTESDSPGGGNVTATDPAGKGVFSAGYDGSQGAACIGHKGSLHCLGNTSARVATSVVVIAPPSHHNRPRVRNVTIGARMPQPDRAPMAGVGSQTASIRSASIGPCECFRNARRKPSNRGHAVMAVLYVRVSCRTTACPNCGAPIQRNLPGITDETV